MRHSCCSSAPREGGTRSKQPALHNQLRIFFVLALPAHRRAEITVAGETRLILSLALTLTLTRNQTLRLTLTPTPTLTPTRRDAAVARGRGHYIRRLPRALGSLRCRA